MTLDDHRDGEDVVRRVAMSSKQRIPWDGSGDLKNDVVLTASRGG